jgi:hypothetical protein
MSQLRKSSGAASQILENEEHLALRFSDNHPVGYYHCAIR